MHGFSRPSALNGDVWRCRCRSYGQRCGTYRNLLFLMVFSSWEPCGPSLGIFRTSPLISQPSRPVLSRYRMPVHESPHWSHSHPIMVGIRQRAVVCSTVRAPTCQKLAFGPSIVSPEHCLGSVLLDGSGLSHPACLATTSHPMK